MSKQILSCPYCGQPVELSFNNPKSQWLQIDPDRIEVIIVRRRRKCPECNKPWDTLEIPEALVLDYVNQCAENDRLKTLIKDLVAEVAPAPQDADEELQLRLRLNAVVQKRRARIAVSEKGLEPDADYRNTPIIQFGPGS